MTPQAKNSINLFKGNDGSTIMTALRMQKASVVKELKEYFKVSSDSELADILSRM